MEQTPLTVGSPQQVIDRTLAFREIVGDYQRQLFLVDHAGLPLKVVLEQMDMLGELVVPVLRREFAANRPADVPTRRSTPGCWRRRTPRRPGSDRGRHRAGAGVSAGGRPRPRARSSSSAPG